MTTNSNNKQKNQIVPSTKGAPVIRKNGITEVRREHEIMPIPIDAPKSHFAEFLADEGNKRIFFSGKFGIGKSYFLEEFFKEHNETYDVYHLSPVRYQISNNENIVELLKYDILVELLKRYSEAFDDKKGEEGGFFMIFAAFWKDQGLTNAFLQYALTTSLTALSFSPDPFHAMLAQLGRPLKELLVLDKEFQKFKKKYLSGDKEKIEKFVNKVLKADIAAPDYISHILQQKIAELKGDRKSVLILDDFDRLDPEHIFRILNVLSVHIDESFGFDHVIIVGDIKNLQSIFHHKYGINTDFWGYFHKFFTKEVYEFDNVQAVREAIPRLLKSIQCDPIFKDAVRSNDGIGSILLEEVLTWALNIKELNLHHLYKPLKYHSLTLKRRENESFNLRIKFIDIGIKLLISVFGDEDHLLGVLRKVRDKSLKTDTSRELVYANYSSLMLQELLTTKHPGEMKWREYQLKTAEDSFSLGGFHIYLDNDQPAHARYFYEVLCEYVEKEKYKTVKHFRHR